MPQSNRKRAMNSDYLDWQAWMIWTDKWVKMDRIYFRYLFAYHQWVLYGGQGCGRVKSDSDSSVYDLRQADLITQEAEFEFEWWSMT